MSDKPEKFICDGCQKAFKHVAPRIIMREVSVFGGETWKNLRFCSGQCCQDWVLKQRLNGE